MTRQHAPPRCPSTHAGRGAHIHGRRVDVQPQPVQIEDGVPAGAAALEHDVDAHGQRPARGAPRGDVERPIGGADSGPRGWRSALVGGDAAAARKGVHKRMVEAAAGGGQRVARRGERAPGLRWEQPGAEDSDEEEQDLRRVVSQQVKTKNEKFRAKASTSGDLAARRRRGCLTGTEARQLCPP